MIRRGLKDIKKLKNLRKGNLNTIPLSYQSKKKFNKSIVQLKKAEVEETVKTFSCAHPDIRHSKVTEFMQPGLVYAKHFSTFATFKFNPGFTLTTSYLKDLYLCTKKFIDESPEIKLDNTSATLGVSLQQYAELCKRENKPIPKGFKLNNTEEDEHSSTVFKRKGSRITDSHWDLWFHIKADESSGSSEKKNSCTAVFNFIKIKIKADTEKPYHRNCSARFTDEMEGNNENKVLGGRFSERVNNPDNKISIHDEVLIGSDDCQHIGGSYVFAQDFQVNWQFLKGVNYSEQENMIGRHIRQNNQIIVDNDKQSHIKCSRVLDEWGNTTSVMRLGLPYGHNETKGEEEGVYFAGFSKEATVLEEILSRQIGNKPNYMNDRLFNFLDGVFGGLFYIPNLTDLEIGKNETPVDWSSITQHFHKRSANGLMYYNHKDYLHEMSLKSEKDRPSFRVLSLLNKSFKLWEDNWYHNRKQEEMPSLLEYLKQEKREGREHGLNGCKINEMSIMRRKGLATKMTMNLISSEKYGFRGYKDAGDGDIFNTKNGADTYHLEPEELIVGQMPNLSLGQGRYCMKYLTDGERITGFLSAVSEASGVGHIVPDYEKSLTLGLNGLIKEVTLYKNKYNAGSLTPEEKQKKNDFYDSILDSYDGIKLWLKNYEELAKRRLGELGKFQEWEKNNLKGIIQRLNWLAEGNKPRTVKEATQLLFTLHLSLHINGEPTAVGRLDQLLHPFYEQEKKTKKGKVALEEFKYEIQETIECFFVKLGEKVQLNRTHVEDHQPYGNLAFGGRSGPYPQGGSNNQWIQQVTVGGTIANNNPKSSLPAYNDITTFAIRAMGRLPLNAPCLSLRVRKDVPQDLLKESAKAILSGGAHPIIYNDDKIIDHLHTSGRNIGGVGPGSVSESVGNKWDSVGVSLKDARDFSADGCYEPQFPGKNWFLLPTMNVLEVIELAINQGRKYSTAGEDFLTGQNFSLNTKTAGEIDSYEEFEDLFFYHFKLQNDMLIYNSLTGYMNNNQSMICPSPLLNGLMSDNVKKGEDQYNGGTRHNVLAASYIAVPNAINSLYVIKKAVFGEKSYVNLETLRKTLICDWGHKMVEPIVSSLQGQERIDDLSNSMKKLREEVLEYDRFQRGHSEIDEFGLRITKKIGKMAKETFEKPIPQIKDVMIEMGNRYGTEEFPFSIALTSQMGTFEGYKPFGNGSGASADGRRNGTYICDDFSPVPYPLDLIPINNQTAPFETVLKNLTGDWTDEFSGCAPTDFNIREDFPSEELEKVLRQFSNGDGSNFMTITTANEKTLKEAATNVEEYDLVRTRMGGWSEFFVAMFPSYQASHPRRPISCPMSELLKKKK